MKNTHGLLTALMLLSAISVNGIGYLLSFLPAIFVHEMGHIALARLLGVRVLSYSIKPQGIKMRFDFLSVSHIRQLLICLGGSIAGMVCSVIPIIFKLYSSETVAEFILISVTLSILNLLPIKGLDGGEILECILDKIFLPDRTYKICKVVSVIFSLMFFVLSVRIQLRNGANLSVMIISLYFLYSTIS